MPTKSNCARLSGIVSILVFTVSMAQAAPPNIIYILADDMGYGDVQALNPRGKIPTPNIDSLARNGMSFTDAHTTSAVCTPTRYSILTGRYNWRTQLENGVLWGYSQPLIDATRTTVGNMLQDKGYATACIGKWHLGMDWTDKQGNLIQKSNPTTPDGWDIDYTEPITNGPTDRGFDYFYGISASLDMFPYIYIQNDQVQGIPNIEKAFHRPGPATKDFEDIDVLPTLTQKATQYIDQQSKTNNPFFLYFPLTAPHTPITPAKEFDGKSNINKYADFVMQVDHTVGQIIAALKRNGITNNTLLIFTSDNGCSPQANFPQLAKFGHNPSYHFRGHKADIYEGGHRVPFIVQWPGQIKPGTTNPQPISLVDLMATCADILGSSIPDGQAPDSQSILPLLKGGTGWGSREAIIHHSINGSFAIRKGDWKLALCPGSGGWSNPRPGRDDLSHLPPVQLYNLQEDISETNNLAESNPEKVKQLTNILQFYINEGRSTPGPPTKNDRQIDIHKAGRQAHQPK